MADETGVDLDDESKRKKLEEVTDSMFLTNSFKQTIKKRIGALC